MIYHPLTPTIYLKYPTINTRFYRRGHRGCREKSKHKKRMICFVLSLQENLCNLIYLCNVQCFYQKQIWLSSLNFICKDNNQTYIKSKTKNTPLTPLRSLSLPTSLFGHCGLQFPLKKGRFRGLCFPFQTCLSSFQSPVLLHVYLFWHPDCKIDNIIIYRFLPHKLITVYFSTFQYIPE